MDDESMVKIMQSLGLDYKPAINSTIKFEQSIKSLNEQLAQMKLNAIQGAKDINSSFSSQLGNAMGGQKTILDQYGVPLQTVQTIAKKSGKDISDGFVSATKAAKEHKQSVEDVANQYNIFGSEWQRRSSWFLSGSLFYGTINAAKEAISTISEVEMGMVEISRVMEDSTFAFKDYRDELLQLGVDYGQTFGVVQDIALRWAQAGYGVRDSLENTKTSLLALNTAELDAKNSTESLIGIMAQWQLTSADLPLLLDKINKTADDFTLTSQDLVDGLLRSSGAAKIMNLSIDETIGLLTVMREASGRTGQEVGNALNSILSYIQRPSSIKTLENLGIDMFADKAKTQFRNVMHIFQDVASKWNTASDSIKDGFVQSADDAGLFNEEMANALGLQEEWNDLQSRDIAQASAGVYRRNYYIGMIERLSNTQGILNGMMDAGGYSMAENERTMDTLEKKVESFKASLERLAVALGDAGYLDAMKGIVDAGTGLLEAFNDIDEETQQAIISFTSMFLLLKTGQKALSFMGISFGTFSKQAADATKTIGGLTLGLGGWVNVALLAASAGFALYNHLKKIDEAKMQAIQTGQQSIQTYQNEISELEKLSNEYDNIAEKTEKTEVEKARLNEIQKELAISFPELISGFDDEGNAMAYNTEATRALIDAKKDLLAQELEALAILAQGRLPELKDEIKETEDRITELTAKLRSGDTTEIIWISHKDGITEVKDMTEEYAQEVVELSESLREQKKEMSDLEKVVKQQEDAQVILNGTLEEAREQLGMLTDAELVELGVVKELSDTAIRASVSRLNEDKNHTDAMIEMTKSRIGAMQSEMNALAILSRGKVESVSAMDRMYSESEMSSANTIDRVSMAQKNKAIETNRELLKLEANAKSIQKALDNLNSIKVPSGGSGGVSGSSSSSADGKKGSKSSSSSYENKALSESLKLLEHRKRISEETQSTIKAEIAELNRINSLYVKTADERMNMAERIYSAEKRYLSKRLQDSTNWINEKKNLNELSVEEEIAAWERVKKNQSNNIEAVKQAELNLYKLREQLRMENFNKEENTIKHLAKIGVYSVKQQIDAYRELYSFKATSIEEERNRTENLFGLYKELLAEQHELIKDSYDERINQIDNEANRDIRAQERKIKRIEEETETRIKAKEREIEAIEEESKVRIAIQNEIINGINKELELLNLRENEYNHEKKMAELQEELAYWQVRTSENAREKVVEILKKIDEAEHDREVELTKQGLEEKKDVAEEEIRSIEDATNKKLRMIEKEMKAIEESSDRKLERLKEEIESIKDAADKERKAWEKSYNLVEEAFDEHTLNVIALARTMSKDAYDEWEKNYLIPLQDALNEGDSREVRRRVRDLDNSVSELEDKTSNSKNAQIYRLANQILGYKKQYEVGNDKTAAQRAKSVYEELSGVSANTANTLNNMTYLQAQEYVKNLPKMHKGGKSLSFGAVEMMPGELTFPPGLSAGLERLFPLLSNLGKSNINTDTKSFIDSRRETTVGTVLHVENMYMEDDTDERSLARELERALTNLY